MCRRICASVCVCVCVAQQWYDNTLLVFKSAFLFLLNPTPKAEKNTFVYRGAWVMCS